jgi:hypothetical protein
MNGRSPSFVKKKVRLLYGKIVQVRFPRLRKNTFLHQLFKGRRVIEMIASKHHGSATPFHSKSNAWDTVQCVSEMECGALEAKGLSDDGWLKSMAVPQERRAQRRQCRVFSNETLVDGWGGYDYHGRPGEHFLERSGIVVSVTMGQNDPDNGPRPDALTFQGGRRIWRRVDHDTSSIDPKDVT